MVLHQNWREYEHLHTLFWLGKDLSWNIVNPYSWVICMVPTFLIGADFIYMAFTADVRIAGHVEFFFFRSISTCNYFFYIVL
jgi:hypothetical protein